MKNILLIEDDPSIQDAAKLALEYAGYSVSLLPNGDSLLDNDFPVPDLFILDKQLSGVDGLDICAFLKARAATKHIPVIMISASPHIGKMAKSHGADDFLEKPFKIDDLRRMVAKYI